MIQWCDTRDMTADGHIKGSVDRKLLIQVMSGQQHYQLAVKRHVPHRGANLHSSTQFYVECMD